jgi:uncharacterized membrane protein
VLAALWALWGMSLTPEAPERPVFVLVMANTLTCAAAALLYTVASQGWRRALLLLALCAAISLGVETIGIATGLPYGTYTYTGLAGPRLPGGVPYIVPAAWFMIMASALHISHRLRRPRWQTATFAAALMLFWDVALDPAATGDFPLWQWSSGGLFYGVPLHNWIGWLATGWVIAGSYLWVAPGWGNGDGRGLELIYVMQGGLAATAAVVSGRWWAGGIWAGSLALVGALAIRSRRARRA